MATRCSASRSPEQHKYRQPANIITLLTDFGVADTYVGVMKGVIAGINPEARIIDLSHGIAPQDVRGAALLLAGSFLYFPPGTIHVAVVDPTVGSDRPALCVQAGRYFFIGPDNGVISIACFRAGHPRIFLLENEEYFLENRSRTFHGRDIFAPVAAHLSSGVAVESLGSRIRSMERIRLPTPVTERGPRLIGEIVYVDRFGNLITNIEEDSVPRVFSRADRADLIIACAGHRVRGLSETYSSAAPGVTVALFGSYGLMEIAVRDGNASSLLGLKRGDRVTVELAERQAS
ncbi:MAG: SAM-dependent chlorinase/fluorinase [Candidatus Hydrogenedentota bacterium]|nr:MAG: SAM-dependent chlorinase/fluorinase [Candidatus Hydrogenedentota bacterium]